MYLVYAPQTMFCSSIKKYLLDLFFLVTNTQLTLKKKMIFLKYIVKTQEIIILM